MGLVASQSAFYFDSCRFGLWLESKGYTVTGGELYRPPVLQKIYFESGASKTMDGQHPKRLAIDLNLFIGGVLLGFEGYREAGAYWKSMHPLNRWGGDIKGLLDGNHFERLES